MQSLAGFAMRGRSQAALVAAGSAVLSLVLPLVALISSAVVALATLRQGPREGALVMGIAGLGSAGLAWLALGAPWPAVGFLLVLWVPLWGLALTLRATGSLALVVQAAALLGLLILVGIYAVTERSGGAVGQADGALAGRAGGGRRSSPRPIVGSWSRPWPSG